MKKLRFVILLCALCALLTLPAWAADASAQKAADALHALGLFQGVSTDAAGNPVYELDRAPTRAEALTMLVRALGKEREAAAGTWKIPFTDVAPWAVPYVGYAYANGLTKGVSATRFDPEAPSDGAVYLTFMLRALGYRDGADADFVWDRPYALASEAGILRVGVNTADFRRGDAALATWYALAAARKGGTVTLLGSLTASGAVTPAAAAAAPLPVAADPRSDAFSRGQSDNYQAGGIVAWEGGDTYFIERTDGTKLAFALRRVAADGSKQTLYRTDGTRLSRLSVHGGKVYFCEDTTAAYEVETPRYSLMVWDPAAGTCREIYHSTIFADYFWYDGVFYLLDVEPGSYRRGYSTESYALRALTPEGRVTATLAGGITWRGSVGFFGWGWDGVLYWTTTIEEPLGTRLWRCDLSTGQTTHTDLSYFSAAAFEYGAFYTLTREDGDDKPAVICRRPLNDPTAAERVAVLPTQETGRLLLRNGTLCFAGDESMKFYAVRNGALQPLFSTGLRAPAVSAFADKVIVAGDLFILAAPDQFTLYDLTAMQKISFSSWLDQ